MTDQWSVSMTDQWSVFFGCAHVRAMKSCCKNPSVFSNIVYNNDTLQQNLLGVCSISLILPGWLVLDVTVGTCDVQILNIRHYYDSVIPNLFILSVISYKHLPSIINTHLHFGMYSACVQ